MESHYIILDDEELTLAYYCMNRCRTELIEDAHDDPTVDHADMVLAMTNLMGKFTP